MQRYVSEIYNMQLSDRMRKEYEAFLTSSGLRDERDADLIAWVSDESGQLVATGALAGRTIKQLAVSEELEGQGLMATVISALVSEAASKGITHLFLCTKPDNARMFGSLGFYEVMETEDAVLMESRKGGAEEFIESIPRLDGVCGAVVCNCDPFTLGHRHLIEHAAGNCDSLYVFALSESGSFFTSDERLEMIKSGTEDIENCHVFASDLYLISRATFPAYFIKDSARAEEVKADLDIEFFAKRLAPALGITKRFVGEEPLDEVTRAYNERLAEILPAQGIEVCEIPRLRDEDGEIISASRVRAILKGITESANQCAEEEGNALKEDTKRAFMELSKLVPRSSYEYICSRFCADAD